MTFKSTLTILAILLSSYHGFGQSDTTHFPPLDSITEPNLEEEIPEGMLLGPFVEPEARYPGGDEAFNKFMADSIVYQHLKMEDGFDSRIYLSFTVDTLGNMTNFEAVKGYNPPLEKEIIRVMKKMPKWEPAVQDGKKVPVKYTLPVTSRY